VNEQGDLIALQAAPIDAGRIIAAIAEAQAGAIAVFLGTTRCDADSGGRMLTALDYHAYEQMALAQMRRMASAARQRWPIRRLAMVHRTGKVEIGQPSVAIAVSTPHRSEAFDACRFLIDSVKAEATIWKKELWADGSESWAQPPRHSRVT
jgi:molybdopterin synthase catalytic subunit